MKTGPLVIIVAIIAVLIILFFILNKGALAPVTTTSSTTHNVTGLDGIISSIQPGVLFGQGGGVSNGGLLGILAGNSNGQNVTQQGSSNQPNSNGQGLQQAVSPQASYQYPNNGNGTDVNNNGLTEEQGQSLLSDSPDTAWMATFLNT